MDTKKTMIYIVRHGETDWNVNRTMQGQRDVPLNAKGRQQAKHIARHLQHIQFDVMYSSPLSRALETALVIAKNRNTEIKTDSLLKERGFGILEGKSFEDVAIYHPAFIFKNMWDFPNFRPPDGESLSDSNKRMEKFSKKILKKHQGQQILIVSHGDVLRSLIGAFLKIPPKTLVHFYMGNAGLAVIEISNIHGPILHVANYQAQSV